MSKLATLILTLALAAVGAAGEAPCYLVDNFTQPLPSGDRVACEVETAQAKVGLGSARVTYRFTADRRQATLSLPDEALFVPGPGQLKLWVKGDASGTELRIVLRHAKAFVDDQGRRRLAEHRDVPLQPARLDFADWRELAFDAGELPADRVAWVQRLELRGRGGDKTPFESTILLDDLRLFSKAKAPAAAMAVGLLGPATRSFTSDVALFLDLRSFARTPAKVSVRVTMADRNDNLVADRDFRLDLAPGESKEQVLKLQPENLQAYLPPFTIACDVLSADLPEISRKLDLKLVMGNSVFLFDDFSDLFGHWFTSGFQENSSRGRRAWVSWAMGEGQRANPWPQTAARISRADIEKGAAVPGRHALRIDFAGRAAVYRSRDRWMPGNPYRLGVWVKGDGSGARLSVLVLDYTDNADFWEGGWRRIRDGQRELCTLDFTDWRYVEIPLPGDGIGSNTPRGSTDDVDFPLELTAFLVEPAKDKLTGSVLLGPVFVTTQQPVAGTLALSVGTDDPENAAKPMGFEATVQNAWPVDARKVKATWALLDCADDEIAKGQADLDIPATQSRSFRIDLAKHAAEVAGRLGPLRLRVTAYTAEDASISATRDLILAKPDSAVALTGFEADRGYLGLKAMGIENAPSPGEPAALTSSDQAHSGKRSLALRWDRKERPELYASVDPPLPGVPVELSMWVWGDGSGVLFYPVIGDQEGISHGAGDRQWDLFLARTTDGPLQNAVRVDWKGWRQLTFRLPAIPPTWEKALPVLGFEASYPLGLHLAVDAADWLRVPMRGQSAEAAAERGTIFVDDVAVRTHLLPEERLGLALDRPNEWNVVAPGGMVQATVANFDAASPRKARLVGGLFDWRGRQLAGIDQALELKPGERRQVVVAKGIAAGACTVRLRLEADGKALAEAEDDLLVADLEPVLGPDWPAALRDEWKLRVPVQDRYTFVDEDWDWVEHYPGNVQLDTIRQRAGRVLDHGAEPYVLLGFSAYWAAGVGLEQLKAGAFERRQRDAGHAVNTFLVPERLEDWDDYACEVMRGVGRTVGGWVLWNNPDSGPIAVEPKRFAQLAASADKWRRVYCPQTPLIIGGMSRASAVPYLKKLAELGALDHITGVNVRLDVGRLSPEDARVPAYVRELQAVLAAGKEPKTVLLTDLDWAVEKGPSGFGAFDQAAYLVRSDLLLGRRPPQGGAGIRPALSIRNDDFARLGLGLTWRREVSAPPLHEQPATFQLKPAWWGVVRTRQWLDRLRPAGETEVQDTVPGRTRCLVYERKADGAPVAIAWRNDDLGHLTFAATGLAVESAEDLLGAAVAPEGGWFLVGKVPTLFVLAKSEEPAAQALARLRVRDREEPAWPQRVLAAFTPATGQRAAYAQSGGEPAALAGRTVGGDEGAWQGIRFPNGGSERFEVDAPQGADLVLRKRFLLDAAGQSAEVRVNGAAVGKWNLRHAEPELAGGLREAIFVVGRDALAGKPRAAIEVRYAGPANTAAWWVLERRGGDFPLSAIGPIHAEQNVGTPRLARNVIGARLAVGRTAFANGIGVFAHSLLEYPLNGQFRRFTARVGVDAVTEGRGSVVFEVAADGRKLWASGILSGLDEAKEVDLDVSGVDRLRLIVTDAGDGNRYDAADWCEPTLQR